jgi:hypothetical protein
MRIQFRWDIFNLFNNTNFLFVGMNNGYSPTTVTYDSPNRASVSSIVSATPAGNFGEATRTRDARQMQFGIKFLW